MLAAASAWDALAADLHAAAASYQSVTTSLSGGPWLGGSSASMARAATRYVAWLHTVAGQAQETAAQARAAASAYETARAMTVPPPVIAANRSLLTLLVATNVVGQNAAAIAATEFHYGEMWAQDAAAMYGYAGASAAATTVTPFTPAAANAFPAALAGTYARDVAESGLMSAVPAVLRGLAAPTSTTSSLQSAWETLNGQLATVSGHARTVASIMGITVSTAGLARAASMTGAAGAAGVAALESGAGALPSVAAPGLYGAGGGAVSAAIGRAALVGALSVPQNWTAGAPVGSPAPMALSDIGSAAARGIGPAAFPLGPIGSMAARAARPAAGAYPFLLRPNMVPRWPIG